MEGICKIFWINEGIGFCYGSMYVFQHKTDRQNFTLILILSELLVWVRQLIWTWFPLLLCYSWQSAWMDHLAEGMNLWAWFRALSYKQNISGPTVFDEINPSCDAWYLSRVEDFHSSNTAGNEVVNTHRWSSLSMPTNKNCTTAVAFLPSLPLGVCTS